MGNTDYRDANIERAREAWRALGTGFRLPDDWQDRVYTCGDPDCKVPSTGKPFTATPGQKVRGKRDGQFVPALWLRVGAPLEKGVRCGKHMNEDSADARRPIYEAARVAGKTEDEARAAGYEVRPFVSLFSVFKTAERDARVQTDPVEAVVVALERQEFPCGVQLAGDKCVGTAQLRDLQGFDLQALRTAAGLGSDEKMGVASKLVALVTDPSKRDSEGLPPLVCRACGEVVTVALGRKVMVKRGTDTYDQTLLVPGSVVARRIKRQALKDADRSDALGAIGQRLDSLGVTLTVERPAQFERDVGLADSRRGRWNDRGGNKRGRRDHEGYGGRGRGYSHDDR